MSTEFCKDWSIVKNDNNFSKCKTAAAAKLNFVIFLFSLHVIDVF